jgi:hypothetical protein
MKSVSMKAGALTVIRISGSPAISLVLYPYRSVLNTRTFSPRRRTESLANFARLEASLHLITSTNIFSAVITISHLRTVLKAKA